MKIRSVVSREVANRERDKQTDRETNIGLHNLLGGSNNMH